MNPGVNENDDAFGELPRTTRSSDQIVEIANFNLVFAVRCATYKKVANWQVNTLS